MSLSDLEVAGGTTATRENQLKDEVREGVLNVGRFMLVDEVSETLGVSRRTIFTYIKENKLSSIKSRGKRLIYTGSVLVYLMKQKVIELNEIKEKELKEEVKSQLKSELWKQRIRKERSMGQNLNYE